MATVTAPPKGRTPPEQTTYAIALVRMFGGAKVINCTALSPEGNRTIQHRYEATCPDTVQRAARWAVEHGAVWDGPQPRPVASVAEVVDTFAPLRTEEN